MWVAVADCCLIKKLSPIHGCRFKVFTIMACPVFHSCQPNHHCLNPFPLQRTSWYYSYHPLLGTQYSNHSMQSPLRRTIWNYHSYHSLLGFACSFPRHRWRVLVGSCYLVVSVTVIVLLSQYLFTWSMSITTTMDYQFIQSIHVA
jgi:hypothetical protein